MSRGRRIAFIAPRRLYRVFRGNGYIRLRLRSPDRRAAVVLPNRFSWLLRSYSVPAARGPDALFGYRIPRRFRPHTEGKPADS